MIPNSTAQLIAYLRKTAPDAVVPAFDKAINATERQLDDLANAATESADRDYYDKDSIALHSAKRSLCLALRNKLIESIEHLGQHAVVKKSKLSLSLIEDEQMQMTLACEKLVERFNHVHRKGVKALDMRLCKILEEANPLGVRMPLSPHVLADCARSALFDISLSEPTKAMVVQEYELFLDPILSDLLKAANTELAKAGILPNLIIQDDEERVRRESLRSSNAQSVQRNSKLSIAAEDGSNTAANDEAELDAEDRALFAELLAEVKSRRSDSNSQAGLLNALAQSNLQMPAAVPRAIAKSDTLSILNGLQHSNSQLVIDALTRGDGSVADTLKREMVKNAHVMGLQEGNEEVGLAQEEETAVDLASNMFEMMLKGRQADDTVAPMLSRMMMPFMKAAVIDPQLFMERQHPARELLNTISEACEDNNGETPQDRELLSHVEKAVARINDEFVDDLSKFEDVSQELSKQMEAHRKRVQLAEKRAADSQKGQERLELARTQASSVVAKAKQEYDYPPELMNFFSGAWQHHLSMTALRKGEDSDDYIKATNFAKQWTTLLDMLSLGEPLSATVIDNLQSKTSEVLSNSGIFDPEALSQFKELMDAVQRWSDEPEPAPAPTAPVAVVQLIVAPEPISIASPAIAEPVISETLIAETAPAEAPSNTAVADTQTSLNTTDVTTAQEALINAPLQKTAALTTAAEILAHAASSDEAPITAEELNEMRALEVGVWLQILKADGSAQKLKIGWISGISGLMMMVNRRGARVLALSPEELVRYQRKGELTIFEREAAVDQALAQLLSQYKKH
jgi:Protein of unknown function (DUF1631)